MIDDKRVLLNDSEETWGHFVKKVCSRKDSELIAEIERIEEFIDLRAVCDCALYDCINDLYESLRDECVRRLANNVSNSNS